MTRCISPNSYVRNKKKAEKVLAMIMETGNIGHNKDFFIIQIDHILRKAISLGRRTSDGMNLSDGFFKGVVRDANRRLISGGDGEAVIIERHAEIADRVRAM